MLLSLGRELDGPKEYVDFLTHFYTVALTGIVESWLRGEMEYTAEELVQMVDQVLQDQILGAVVRNGRPGIPDIIEGIIEGLPQSPEP